MRLRASVGGLDNEEEYSATPAKATDRLKQSVLYEIMLCDRT